MEDMVIAVEGVSDRVVLDLLAQRLGRDLSAEGIEIVPIGGAHAIRRFVDGVPDGVAIRGLCDANEARLFRRVLDDVHVCDPDLEGEILRALGVEAVEAALGDGLASFRMFQQQPAQRGRPVEPQLHRWLRSSSTRFHRYLPILVEALDLERLPQPLRDVLGKADQPGSGSSAKRTGGGGLGEPEGSPRGQLNA